MEIVYPRVAAIDVHKKQITVAVRVPGAQVGQRRQQVRKYPTFYSALREMTAWLLAEQVTHVAMEATGVYWRPVLHALAEADRLKILLCNAHHVKNVRGRKTDASDAVWLAELCEVGLLHGRFIPPSEIAAIRELARYRKKLIEERTRKTQRLHKVLEDGGIKLDSVASDATGVSGQAMIEALIARERDPAVLADLAKGVLRKKNPRSDSRTGRPIRRPPRPAAPAAPDPHRPPQPGIDREAATTIAGLILGEDQVLIVGSRQRR